MNAFVAAYSSTPADLVICNITSNASQEAIDGAALYGGPKAALELVTRTIEQEAIVKNMPRLKAFCINPGSMDTGMQGYLRSPDIAGWERSALVRKRYEAGLVRSPADVASAITRVLRDPTLAPGPVFVWDEVPSA